METQSNKSKAMLVHLSTFTQWVFPFGNFIAPLVIWSSTKKDSKFVDNHGREAINFQLSVLTYSLVLCLIAVPIFVFTVFRHVPFTQMAEGNNWDHELTPENISGIVILAIMAVVLFAFMKVAEFFLVIFASVKASEGIAYKYPLCIPFLSKPDQLEESVAQAEESEVTDEITQENGVQSSSSEESITKD